MCREQFEIFLINALQNQEDVMYRTCATIAAVLLFGTPAFPQVRDTNKSAVVVIPPVRSFQYPRSSRSTGEVVREESFMGYGSRNSEFGPAIGSLPRPIGGDPKEAGQVGETGN